MCLGEKPPGSAHHVTAPHREAGAAPHTPGFCGLVLDKDLAFPLTPLHPRCSEAPLSLVSGLFITLGFLPSSKSSFRVWRKELEGTGSQGKGAEEETDHSECRHTPAGQWGWCTRSWRQGPGRRPRRRFPEVTRKGRRAGRACGKEEGSRGEGPQGDVLR